MLVSLDTAETVDESNISLFEGKTLINFVSTDDELLSNLESILSFIKKSKSLAFDIETSKWDGSSFTKNGGVDWDRDVFSCFSISDGVEVWVIHNIRLNPTIIKQILEEIYTKPLMGQNIKFDLKFVERDFGIIPQSAIFDTEIASRVVLSLRGRSHKLGDIMERELGVSLDKSLQTSNWGGMIITNDQVRYSALDTFLLPKLVKVLVEKLNKIKPAYTSQDNIYSQVWGLRNKVMQLEMSVLPAFMQMEKNGFNLDRNLVCEKALGLVKEEEEAIWEFLKEAKDNKIKPKSPPAYMVPFLNRKYPGAFVYNEEGEKTYLRDLDSVKMESLFPFTNSGMEIIDILHKIKSLGNYKNRLEEFRLKTSPNYTRIHTSFRQLGTETGRTSCPKPNLQNIPAPTAEEIMNGDFIMRSLFVAPPGKKLIVCDYSQIQLVICAQLTQDEEMMGIINTGGDLHIKTASIISGRPESDIGKKDPDRQKAKAVNFGLIFGMQAPSLVTSAKRDYHVDFTLPEAEQVIERYFDFYHGVRDWHRQVKRSERNGFFTSYTLFGRKVVGDKFTKATNYGIQGSEADIMKLAMFMIHQEIKSRNLFSCLKIVNMVHDELVLEVDADRAEEMKALVESAMVRAGKFILKSVLVKADGKIVDNWADGK